MKFYLNKKPLRARAVLQCLAYALFWSSSEDPVFDQSNTASYWWFNKDNTHLGGFEGVGNRGYKEYRLSVRCIQDYSVDP